jgi:twitching motility protein PilU
VEREQAIKYMRDLLRLMVDRKGSDLFITVDFPPAIKMDGKVQPVSKTKLSPDNTKALTYAIMNDRQLKEFEGTHECNFAIAPAGIGRFRVNAFVQQGHTGMVLRTIETTVPTLENLGLPEVLKEISMTKRGLVIMVGGTGSGKSTSLAAMINHRNENSYGHIITIEDPIEYIHPHKNCVVTQREVGVDTEDWGVALKNTLRQAPDVILLGEIRDRATMEFGLAFAETGHLAMATLHANSSNQALDRVINFFPEERHQQLFMDLSLNMKAIVSQRLLKKVDGRGRAAAIEIMLNSPLISDLILKGEIHQIKEVMSRSNELGMKTFDQALFDLYEADLIAYEDALRNADSMNELRLKIKLQGKAAQGANRLIDAGMLELEEDEDAPGVMMR